MKKLFSLIFFIALTISCVSQPIPIKEKEGDSLIIGNLIVDFPDGFFNEMNRSFENRIKMKMRDMTNNREFILFTSKGGYFYFRGRGSDSYLAVSYEIGEVNTGIGRYTLGEMPLGAKITSMPDKIVYVGNTVVSYRTPRFADIKVGAQDTHYWNFTIWLQHSFDKESLIQHLYARKDYGKWRDVDIVETSPQKN